MYPRLVLIAITVGLFLAANARAESLDAAAAEALIKKSKCSTCHSLDKKKEGPAYKETAAKYKGKPDGTQKLFTHLTTSPKVKIEGKEETHDNPKTTNEADIKNLVAWILSR